MTNPPTNLQADFSERYKEAFYYPLQRLKLSPHWHPPSGFLGGLWNNKADGSSLEFKHHRPYAPGDDERRVDWPLYGRTRRLYSRIQYAEHYPRLFLLLDTSASMAVPSWREKFQTSLDLVVALAYIGLNSGYHVRCIPMSGAVNQASELSWHSSRELMVNAPVQLANLKPAGETQFNILPQYAYRWRNTGGIVIIISDFLVDVPVVEHHGQKTTFDSCKKISQQAQRRLTLAVQKIAVPLRSFTGVRFRTALVAISGHQEERIKDTVFLQDAETGNRHHLIFNARIEKSYRNTRICHQTLLRQMCEKQGASFTPIIGGIGIRLRDLVQSILTDLAKLDRERHRF